MERNGYEKTPRLPPVLGILLAIAALYFAREILVPLSAAVLVSFLLTAAVRFMERGKLGRLPSVMLVFMVAVACAAGVGYVVGNQLFDVLNELPSYKANLRTKMESLRGRPDGSLAKATASVQELSKELAAPKQEVAETPRTLSKTQKSPPPCTGGAKPVPRARVDQLP